MIHFINKTSQLQSDLWHPKEGDKSTWNYVYFAIEMKQMNS